MELCCFRIGLFHMRLKLGPLHLFTWSSDEEEESCCINLVRAQIGVQKRLGPTQTGVPTPHEELTPDSQGLSRLLLFVLQQDGIRPWD